jgi:hypothetical protein
VKQAAGKSVKNPRRHANLAVQLRSKAVHFRRRRKNRKPQPRQPPRSQRPTTMPQGDKSSYTNKQKRQASHIEEGYEKKGVSRKTAEKRAWATVNKQDGGGKKKRTSA